MINIFLRLYYLKYIHIENFENKTEVSEEWEVNKILERQK